MVLEIDNDGCVSRLHMFSDQALVFGEDEQNGRECQIVPFPCHGAASTDRKIGLHHEIGHTLGLNAQVMLNSGMEFHLLGCLYGGRACSQYRGNGEGNIEIVERFQYLWGKLK